MQIGIVVKAEVWLYGTNRSNVIDELLMGWAVGILKETGEWLRVVTHYGYEGYLKREDICFCTQENLKQRDKSNQMVFINKSFADIMEEPSVCSRILLTIGKGSFVRELTETKNGYRKVQLSNGQEGYLPSIFYEHRRESDNYLYESFSDFGIANQNGENLVSERVFRQRLLFYADDYLGTQYRWAGKSSKGLDCSGFIFMCYLMCGILIYRDAKIKDGYPVHQISEHKRKPGDLLYFPGHVAMYIGNQKYIHTTGNKGSFGCVINSLAEEDGDYRQDLAEMPIVTGSIF